jgi:hypothetical protein
LKNLEKEEEKRRKRIMGSVSGTTAILKNLDVESTSFFKETDDGGEAFFAVVKEVLHVTYYIDY